MRVYPVIGVCPVCSDRRRIFDELVLEMAPCPRCTCCECGKYVAIMDECPECAEESGCLIHDDCCDGDS